MKKLCISLCLILTILTSAFVPTINVQAQTTSSSYRQELSNGYYAIISIETTTSLARSTTKTATKTYNIYSSSNNKVASFRLIGTFNYPINNTATCVSTRYETSVYDNSWSFRNCSTSKSGNTAFGSFTCSYKVGGIINTTESKTITLSCDKNGNFN